MAQTLQQLFGASATKTGTQITINLTDFPNLNTANPTASQACAAYLLWLKDNTKAMADDPTAGVAASDFEQSKTFVTRGNPAVAQEQHPITFNLYRPDTNTTLDPDDVI
jgi:hypothetical protein